jgi:hypothetical protein
MMGALATTTARVETAADEEAVTRAELEPQVAGGAATTKMQTPVAAT